ncbi:hypothetical protein WMF18_32725 [Sorangium sp. So ce315]
MPVHVAEHRSGAGDEKSPGASSARPFSAAAVEGHVGERGAAAVVSTGRA